MYFHVCETQRTRMHVTDTTATRNGHQMAVVTWDRSIANNWNSSNFYQPMSTSLYRFWNNSAMICWFTATDHSVYCTFHEICWWFAPCHYNDVIMGAMASQITSLTVVYSTVYSNADLRKHQSSASLAFVWRIHRWPVNSPHKWPVTQKMFPFDDVIMVVIH